MWIIIGLCISVALFLARERWLSHRDNEMGSVSGQWLAEYRQDHES